MCNINNKIVHHYFKIFKIYVYIATCCLTHSTLAGFLKYFYKSDATKASDPKCVMVV